MVVSTVGTQHSTVRGYDNLHNSLPDATKKADHFSLSTREREITLKYANVQKQPNDCECGLFATVFTTARQDEAFPNPKKKKMHRIFQ